MEIKLSYPDLVAEAVARPVSDTQKPGGGSLPFIIATIMVIARLYSVTRGVCDAQIPGGSSLPCDV